jgi:hypothetical protein
MIPPVDFARQPINLHQARRQARVTDHALVRYMERVIGLPVEQIRAEMLTDTVLQAMSMNASSVSGDGFKLVIDNFSIVTTLDADTRVAITPARRREVEG